MAMRHKLGRGTLLTQFDARDAYKQLRVRVEDLHQQCFMAGGKFWVDFCASFGSLYGNDAYSRFAYVHRVCLARAAECPLLKHYVDNYINFTPQKSSPEECKREAGAEAGRLRRELKESGIRFHEWQDPTTRLTFLGWIIDTLRMTVEMTPERREWMISFLGEWLEKESFTLKDVNSRLVFSFFCR